jgi:F-type H+-transporting ATPase subunit a
VVIETLVSGAIAATAHSATFVPPTIDEFYPPDVLFAGTPFALNRILLIRLVSVAALLVFGWLGVRRLKVVPGRWQGVLEFAYDFVWSSIVEGPLGKRQGRRFEPLLMTIFFMILFMNVTSVIPGLQVPSTALIGVPFLLGIVSWAAFVYAGIKDQGGWHFFVHELFPKGVPWPLYILIAPVEFISTFIFRPLTLALRLTMNMFVGHLLLALLFGATSFFLFEMPVLWKAAGLGMFLFGFIFTLFELFMAGLQTYIFTLLTANYIQMSLAQEH